MSDEGTINNVVKRWIALLVIAVGLVGCGGLTARVEPDAEPSRAVANQRFIDAVAPYAQQAQREYGVPASVSIGQAILESGWGRSGLTVWGGAYFGIKCSKTPSPLQAGCVTLSSLEYYDPDRPVAEDSSFRIYKSPADSFADHGRFLRSNPRYSSAFDTTDPDSFITRVAKAGYATDPKYAALVRQLINDHDLTRFDGKTAANSVPVDGIIGLKWHMMGGKKSILGPAIGAVTLGPRDSTLVVFSKGVIIATPDHGAHALTGPLWQYYRTHPAQREQVGPPIADAEAHGTTATQQFRDATLVYDGTTTHVKP